LIPGALALLAAGALAFWFLQGSGLPLRLRVPGTDRGPDSELGTNASAILLGKLLPGTPLAPAPEPLPGSWPQFRGPNRDGASPESTALQRSWPNPPRVLWSVEVGEGYAGPAVFDGRVYLMDYDREKKSDALRCLSLRDGSEVWRFTYPVSVKRNHGMSRTVPAVTTNLVVAIGPKCHTVCVDAHTGELRWGIDLVREHGTTVPPWYAGQCPLIDTNAVILAPGGPEALVMAVNAETGAVLWKTPNPRGWKMTHSSLTPVEIDGERMYIYCADKGVAGVSARDGSLLWDTTEWKISIATVPSPVPMGGGKVFLSGGYGAGSMLLEIKKEETGWKARSAWKLPPEVFGATQQSPIFHEGNIYGVLPAPDARFVCLNPEGKTLWASDAARKFGLGPFLIADGLIFAMNDSGLLRLMEANPAQYRLLGEAQVLKGHDSWGPLALAGGRLLARDLTQLVCLDVARP
jgi:outer membrane protein assembly factor BamB